MPTAEHRKFLSELPKDWEKVPISALGEVHAGSTPRRSNPQYWNGSIAWVTPGELTDLSDKWLTETEDFITEAGLSSSSTKLMPPGTLLVTTRATIGNIAIATIPITTNQGFKNIVPNDTTEPEFYYYMLQLIIPEMQRLASGSTFKEISGRNFSSIIVPRPPVAEQRRIANILDTADAAIRETEAVIAKLKQVKAGLLHDLLTRGLDENGRLRDPQRHPEQFKKVSAYGNIPIDWKWLPISELSERVTYGFTNPMPTTSEGPLMLTATDIEDGKINYSAARHTSSGAFEKLSNKSKPKVGDILVTKDGTLGRVAVLDREDVCINQSVAFIRPLPKADSRFLAHYLRSDIGRQRMLADAGGSTIKHIYITKLADMKVPVAPAHESESIRKVIRAHDARIRTEEEYRDKLRQIKCGLMQDLLTGRVRV